MARFKADETRERIQHVRDLHRGGESLLVMVETGQLA
jgi:hypothetical protein